MILCTDSPSARMLSLEGEEALEHRTEGERDLLCCNQCLPPAPESDQLSLANECLKWGGC